MSDNASAEAKMRFVHQEIEAELKRVKHRRSRDKRKALTLELSTVSLSGVTSILLGLDLSPDQSNLAKTIALVLSVSVTVLAAWDAFFNHRTLWIARTVTQRDLEALERRARFALSFSEGGPVGTLHEQYLSELEDILSGDQQRWMALREGGEAAKDHKSLVGNEAGERSSDT